MKREKADRVVDSGLSLEELKLRRCGWVRYGPAVREKEQKQGQTGIQYTIYGAVQIEWAEFHIIHGSWWKLTDRNCGCHL